MKRNISIFFIGLMSFFLFSSKVFAEELQLFSGAAFKKPMDEIVSLYEKKTGTRVYAAYGSVKTVMSQAILTKQGDVFVVPSSDIMDKVVKKGVVQRETIKSFAYAVPVIVVHKGNPKNIKGLKDLLRDDVRFAMANPENVYIGMLAAEIFDRSLSPGEISKLQKKVVTYADDVPKLLSYLILNQVDAILGFDFMKGWNPDKTEIVKLKPDEIVRISAGQTGVITYSKNRERAKEFIDFLLSTQGQNIFKKYGYQASEKEAFNFAGKKLEIGGEPEFSGNWIKQ
ncbi:MAG: molybdate ABC transporter substrate-binding protein [Deferribacterales bacterium]